MTERKLTATDVLRPVIKVGLLGVGAGIMGGVSIVLRGHQELTHRSIKLPTILQKLSDFEQRTVTVDTRFWAAVHRIHHEMTDVALAPFGRIANAVNWIRENPDRVQGVKIPETIRYLDPFVERFTLEEVMNIGNLANEYFKHRLRDKYRVPESYTSEELNALLYPDPEKPPYLYSNEKHTGDYTLDNMMDILGGDPHSPARFPSLNGVRSELLHIPKANEGAAGLFWAHPELLPEDLQRTDGRYRRPGKLDVALGFGVFSAAVLVSKGKYTPKDVLIAVIQGSVINGIKIGLQLIGGNSVNAFGHAGDPTEKQVVSIIWDRECKMQPNQDGTLSTDADRMGWIGQLIKRLTFEEAGKQKEHHNDPSKIAYTSQEDWQACLEVPWGSTVSYFTRNRLLSHIIEPGLGFDLREGERRPDQPHPAVKIIDDIRADQIKNAR